MDVTLEDYILAAVAADPDKVKGNCPLFIAGDAEEQQRTSLLLARILGGVVHDLENGVYIIVRH